MYVPGPALCVCLCVCVHCRSKERLEQWRAGAREDHLRPCPVEPGFSRATDTAPFATEREYRTEHSQTEHRLEVNIYMHNLGPL